VNSFSFKYIDDGLAKSQKCPLSLEGRGIGVRVNATPLHALTSPSRQGRGNSTFYECVIDLP